MTTDFSIARKPLVHAPRGGMTLIELLVVVAIVVIVFAALIPNLRPAMESARLRETARQVNAYIASAQALAALHGRSGVGVVIARQNTPNNNGCLEVFTVESPPPYAGDSQNSYAAINGSVATLNGASYLESLGIGNGDFIRFGYRGPYYQISNAASGQVTFSSPDGYMPPNTTSIPFQIFRKPVRSATAALQLPRGACIDVSNSGIGQSHTFPQAPTGMTDPTQTMPITIMFSPTGGIGQLYIGQTPVTPTSSVHLLIGKYDKLGSENLADQENRWISIHYRTGRVTTEANAANPDGSPATTVDQARRFALQGKGMGGL